MWEESLIRFCSPTLANIKTGNLFMCPFASKEQMLQSLLETNRMLLSKGIRIIPLRYTSTKALIYAYRPTKLLEDLQSDDIANILKNWGYPTHLPEKCILHLISRLTNKDFPHEIGLFLGYPPEDVLGFIRHHATNYKCFGEWMVYGNEMEAKRTFARYKFCTDTYLSMFYKGKTIAQLVVASN